MPRFRSVQFFIIMQDIRRNDSPKYVELCMEMQCWCPSRWAPKWQQETKTNICHALFCNKSRNTSLKELINITVILFLIQWLFRWQIPQNESLFSRTWPLSQPPCICHVMRRLIYSRVVYNKVKKALQVKICLKISF